jgi:hypothetical protein
MGAGLCNSVKILSRFTLFLSYQKRALEMNKKNGKVNKFYLQGENITTFFLLNNKEFL